MDFALQKCGTWWLRGLVAKPPVKNNIRSNSIRQEDLTTGKSVVAIFYLPVVKSSCRSLWSPFWNPGLEPTEEAGLEYDCGLGSPLSIPRFIDIRSQI